MKACPTCHKEYDDNQANCPDDGSVLLETSPSQDEASSEQVDAGEAEDLEATPQGVQASSAEQANEAPKSKPMEQEESASEKQEVSQPTSTPKKEVQKLTSTDEQEEITADFDPKQVKSEAKDRSESPTSPQQKPKAISAWMRYTGFALAALVAIALLYTLFLREGATLEKVEIHSTPEGALVTVDGAPLGPSPVITELSLGDHTLRLEMEGYQTLTESIDVSPDNPIIQKTLQAE